MKVKIKIDKNQLRERLAIIDPVPLDLNALEQSFLSKVPKQEPPVDYTPAIQAVGQEINVVREEVKSRARATGAKGIQLFVDGSRKGMTAQAVNLIAGTGVTLTYNYSNGRNDVTVSSTASGGTSVLAATGTVNGLNTSFTFASAPVIIIVDGVPRQKTQSDGTANWTGTTSVTLLVAPNFDIYGLG